MATPSVTRSELERILTVEERNAIVMRMREGGGPIGKRHAAEVLNITVEEYDELCDKAREKIARAKLRREMESEPVRPIAEAAADAAGVERILRDPIDAPDPGDGMTHTTAEAAREASIAAEEGLRSHESYEPEPVRAEPDTERVPPLPGTRRDMALQTLRRQTEPIRQSKLSEEAGVPTGSIVDVMLSLEREGLAERIERHGGGPSGRGVFWRATPVGSDAGAEQRSEDGDDTAPDIDRGRDPRPANATDAASSAPGHSSVAVGSRNTLSRSCSICGAEPGELHVNPPDDDVTDAPGGDIIESREDFRREYGPSAAEAERGEAADEMHAATEDIPSPDIGLGDPNERPRHEHSVAGTAARIDRRDSMHPPAMLEHVPPPPRLEHMEVAGNGAHASFSSIEGTGLVDIYAATLIGRLQIRPPDEDADDLCDRIERVLGIGSGTPGE